jgi:probable F420-dependent oxidoreductase
VNLVRYGIAIPQTVPGGGFDPVALQAFLTRAEALGFDSAWTSEQVVGTLPVVSPLPLLAYAAACTERIRLGCSVLVSPLHSPVHLAKDLASLDQLSRGRLEVGLGSGGGFRAFSAFGVDGQTFVARFNEGLDLVRALWTEPTVDHEGRFWQLKGVAMEPKPVQRPGPPVWFGGGHPDAVRRAVRRADGFFGAGSATTAQFAAQVEVARQALDDTGRDPATFRIAKRVYLAVDDDVDRARRTVTAGLHGLYDYFGLPDLTPVAVHGPPDAVVEGVRAVIDAGAELVLLNPLADDAHQLERLAAEVIPHLT